MLDKRTSLYVVSISAALFHAGLGGLPARADEEYEKLCKIGSSVETLEADGTPNSCRALAVAASAQDYQLGCREKNNEKIALTTPISVTDKSARITSSSLAANADNTNWGPEQFGNCAKLWAAR